MGFTLLFMVYSEYLSSDPQIEDGKEGTYTDDDPKSHRLDKGLDAYLLYHLETQTGSYGEKDSYQALFGNIYKHIIYGAECVRGYVGVEDHGKHKKENKPRDGHL